MSGRGLVIGAFWFENDRIDRVIAAPDGREREAIDKLIEGLPEDIRAVSWQFLRPLLERDEPAKASLWPLPQQKCCCVWWKLAHLLGDV